MTEIAPCPRCGYGAGPQGAERYWEARWRDEKAHNDALVKALEEITEGKGRYSQNAFEHACNTIEDMKQIATDALAAVGGVSRD